MGGEGRSAPLQVSPDGDVDREQLRAQFYWARKVGMPERQEWLTILFRLSLSGLPQV